MQGPFGAAPAGALLRGTAPSPQRSLPGIPSCSDRITRKEVMHVAPDPRCRIISHQAPEMIVRGG
jgi:hypothetical protein